MTRAFRISFNTDVSKFTVEIQGFAGLYWKPAKVTEFRGEKDEFRASQNFDTYQLARDYVKRIGLDQIYEDFTIAKPYGAPGPTPTLLIPTPRPATWNIPYPSLHKDQAA